MTVDSMREVGGSRPRPLVVLVIGVLLALGFGFGATQAQDASDDAVVTHPAHIHAGTCAELDPNPAAPLNNVAPIGYDEEDDDDDDDPEVRGALTTAPVETSHTEAEINFDELFETAHAINVHESDQNVQNYIACGDIGGAVEDDKVIIALQTQNDSGYFGIAILEKDGDDKTNVTIYLARTTAADGEAPADETPEASPEA